jgi:hypothetical protein
MLAFAMMAVIHTSRQSGSAKERNAEPQQKTKASPHRH